jgi:ethanolamine ammonia-lyase small subunit
MTAFHTQDPWNYLQRATSARIALGRAGGSLPTQEVLRFSMDHAAARDAVWTKLDVEALRAELTPLGLPIVFVRSQVPDRDTYLKRPDLGRLLDASSERSIDEETVHSPREPDLALIVADGLSALAAQTQVPALLRELIPVLRDGGFALAPLVIAVQARVAIQDAIGSRLRAKCSLILIGERPGLGSPDSLGAYLVFNPTPGKTNADRNCVSNIRPGGLPPAAAARTLQHLIAASLRLQISGVELKDERLLAPSPGLP